MGQDSEARGAAMVVVRAQLGDRRAMELLLRETRVWLVEYLTRLMGDRHGAEDVCQEVLVTIVRRLRYLREARAYRAWVYRIAGRRAVREMTRGKRRREVVGEGVDRADAPIEPVDRELLEQIEGHISHLGPNTREALVLHYYERLTIATVAAVLDVPEGTVKSRIAYGLARVRERINRKES